MIRNEVGTCKVLLYRQSTTYYHATQSGCYMSWFAIHTIFFNHFSFYWALCKNGRHIYFFIWFFAGSYRVNWLDLKRIPESSKVGTFFYNNFAVLSFFYSNDLIYYKPQKKKKTRLRWRKTAEICCHQGVVVVFSSISTWWRDDLYFYYIYRARNGWREKNKYRLQYRCKRDDSTLWNVYWTDSILVTIKIKQKRNNNHESIIYKKYVTKFTISNNIIAEQKSIKQPI